MHDAEDGDVGADGDGERRHRDRGEPRAPPEHARRVPEVLDQALHALASTYSARSALTGATRVARHAGTKLAASATSTRNAAAEA